MGVVAMVLFLCAFGVPDASSADLAVNTTPHEIVLRGATIDDGAAMPADAEVVDVSGKYIAPGLIDAHVHFGQTGFFEARPDYVDVGDRYPYEQTLAYQKRHADRYFPAYLGSGVTSVFDLGGAPWTLDLHAIAWLRSNAIPRVATGF